MRRLCRITIHHRAQRAHAREMIRLADAPPSHSGLNQQNSILQVRRAFGELHVRAVHEATGLVTHDADSGLALQLRADRGRRPAQRGKIMMRRQLHDLELSAHVDLADDVEQMVHGGMTDGTAPVETLCLGRLVRLPYFRHRKHRQQRSLDIA